MFTKLHIDVQKYGGKTKFSAKIKKLKQPIAQRDILRLTGNLYHNSMNELY